MMSILQMEDTSGTIKTIQTYSNGLSSLVTTCTTHSRFIHLKFTNKCFDFITPRKLYADIIYNFVSDKTILFENIKFGWSYTSSIKTLVYKPHEVFLEDFNINSQCACELIPRF